MGWVGGKPIQSFVLYLSDAFDTDACAPVRSKTFLTFWSMLEMGFSEIAGPGVPIKLTGLDWTGRTGDLSDSAGPIVRGY